MGSRLTTETGFELMQSVVVVEDKPMNEELLLRAVAALEHLANPGLRWGDIIALSVGLVQCSLIAWGLWLMRQSARHRDQHHEETMAAFRQQDEESQRRHERSIKQHEENMAAFRQQGEALRNASETSTRKHEETMAAFRQQGEALKVLIERTSG